MQKGSTLAEELWPYLLPKVQRVNRNGGGGTFIPGSGGGGSSTLAGLDDVNIPSPANGNLLGYDSGTATWIDLVPAAGVVWVAGNGIDIFGTTISAKVQAAGGIGADSGGLFIVKPTDSGLNLSASGLAVGAGDGIEIFGGTVAVDSTEIVDTARGLGVSANDIYVRLGTASGLAFNGDGSLRLGSPDDLDYATTNASLADGHTHNILSSADVSSSGASTLLHAAAGDLGLQNLTLAGDLNFILGNRNITGSNALHIKPAGDLYLESAPATGPRGNVVFPDDQTARTPTFNQFIAGIDGWNIAWLGGYKHQLSISNILVDNLFAHKFTADEARVQRGEWFLTRSYGIVETAFTVPAIGINVDVWFEEAPGLGNFKLFLPNNWVEFRTIDWGTGLVIQTVWFQVVDAGASDYVQRLPATTTRPSVQQWRLKRMAGGFTGAIIAKGETGADFGLPTTAMPAGQLGQGVVYASSLYEPDFGPFIEVQVFDSIAGGYPHFENKVRMGNLQTTVDFTAPAWGFAAADDLSVLPSAGMSGFAVDAKLGARFFNTDITLYADDGIPVIKLARDHGLAFRYDDVYTNFDPYRILSWAADLDTAIGTGLPGVAYLAGFVALSNKGEMTRGIKSEVYNQSGGTETLELSFLASSAVSASANLVLLSNTDLGTGSNGSYIGMEATQVDVRSSLQVQHSSVFDIDRSVLNLVEASTRTNRNAGMTIEQQGLYATDGISRVGDAVLHWRLRDAADLTPPLTDVFYSMGIDFSDQQKWKLSANERLGVSDIIVYDPATGEVTINGWSPTGSTPPSGLVAGDGITLAGSIISVKSDVARTWTQIIAGAGLTGGGAIGADRTLAVVAAAGSGILVSAGGVAINDSLAGAGLTMLPGKVLTLDATEMVTPARAIYTDVGSGLQGGGTLAADLHLSINLNDVEPGLSLVGGLTVDGSVVRVTRQITTLAGTGLSGGGFLSADLGLSVLLAATNPGLSMASGLTVLLRSANPALSLSGGLGVLLNATNPALDTAGGLGVLLNATNPALDTAGGLGVLLGASNPGLTKVGGLAVDSSVVRTTYVLTAGAGLTGTGDLSAPRTFNVVAGNGTLTVNADDVVVNQGFAFAWTGAQSWAAAATFNSAPQIGANLAFIGADRTITASANLTVQPATNLTLDPTGGIVYLPNDVEERSVTFADVVTGIQGFRLWSPTSPTRELVIGSIKTDNLTAKAFTTDLIRLEQGDSYWGKGFGIVNANFNLPAVGADIDVWFDNVSSVAGPSNTTGPIFEVNDKLQCRLIIWTVGLSLKLIWFNVKAFVAFDDAAFRQQWKLTRIVGGSDGDLVVKGNVLEDAGAAAQGWIHVTSQKSSAGPFMEFGQQNTYVSGAPTFTQYVRIGQLSGTVDYAAGGNFWGFATGNNLGIGPTAGFSGLTLDKDRGTRLFNTAYQLFSGSNLVMAIEKAGGISIESTGSAFNTVGWYDDLGSFLPDGTLNLIGQNQIGSLGVVKTIAGYNLMDVLGQGFAGASTSGAVRLRGQNSGGSSYNVWVEAGGIFFGSESATTAKSQTAGFIKDTAAYFAGPVGIGNSDPVGQLEVMDTSVVSAYRGITSTQINAGIHAPIFSAMKARGTRASKAAVASGDFLLFFGGHGWDGSAWVNSAAIAMKVSGVVSAGQVPTEIAFRTSVSGAAVDRMIIDRDGLVGIGPQASSAVNQLVVWNNQTVPTFIQVTNDTVTGSAQAGFLASVGANNAQFVKRGPTSAAAGILAANDMMLYNSGNGDIAIRNGNVAGSIKLAVGAGTVPDLMINNQGNIGIGTATPGQGLAGSYNYPAGTVLAHVRSGGQAALIAEGDTIGVLNLIDRGAGTNLKWIQLFSDGGVSALRAVNDTGSIVTFNFMTLAHATGLVTMPQGINLGNTTLGDYLEGTWAVVITPVSGAFASLSYTLQSGKYTRIGNVVFYSISVTINLFSIGTASGNARFSLPMAVFASQGGLGSGTYSASGGSIVQNVFAPQGGTTYGLFLTTTAVPNPLQVSALFPGQQLFMGGHYFV